MVTTVASCPVCGYPVAAKYEGQAESCPNCGSGLVAQGVTIPTWLLTGTIAFALGMILGPALLGTTEAGSQWLAKQARRKLA